MPAFDFYDIAILTGVVGLTVGYLVWKNSNSTPAPVVQKTPSAKPSIRSRSLLDKLKTLGHEKMVVMFFGSQTGTAEDLANRTQNDIAAKLNIPSVVLDPDDYDMEELQDLRTYEKDWVLGFFMATYGEGEPTDNSADFYTWIMDGTGTIGDKGEQDDHMTESKILEGVPFFVFGLGNKTYEHFNAIGRRLDKRFEKLGAKRVGERGEGDDDSSMEEDYLKWVPKIVDALGKHFGIDVSSASQQSRPHIPLFNTQVLESSQIIFKGEMATKGPRKWEYLEKDLYKEVNPPRSFDTKQPFYGRIAQSKTLFNESYDKFEFKDVPIQVKSKKAKVEGNKVIIPRQCYHIEVDLTNSGITYKTGDHIGVWGSNNPGQVEKLAKFLKVEDLDAIIKLVPNPENALSQTAKTPFPHPSSIRTILTHYVDILAIILAKYASDEKEKERLFSLSENREEFVSFVENGQKTLACVLEDFNSIKVPLSVALTEILRPVTVRYYSISSSSLENPKLVTITAVVVRYAIAQNHLNASGKNRVVSKEGFATSWLERLHEKNEAGITHGAVEGFPTLYIPLYIRTSSFRLPKENSKPVIMVGPGTGVAPFRGFIRERYTVAASGQAVGPTWLFFGSRNEKNDNLYAEEFAELDKKVKDNKYEIDLRIITAFSRDSSKRVYVQHRLEEYGSDVWNHLKTGYFYVCGDAKHMAADVTLTLEKIGVQHGGLSPEKATEWVKSLRSQNRYLEDVWA